MQLKNLFSVSFYETYAIKKWIFHIFGIRFSHRKKKKKGNHPTLLNTEVSKLALQANRNLISYIITYLPKTANTDLFCLKNKEICYIFNKKVLEWGPDLFKSFLLNGRYQMQWLCSFEQLSPDNPLYEEHIDRAKKGEFLFKYVRQNPVIIHKFISMDKNKNIFVNQKVLDDSFLKKSSDKPHFVVKNSSRPFYEGITVSAAVYNKSDAEKTKILIDLIEYIFKNFSLPSGKIEGRLYDCHLNNFILDTQGNFHFIDDDYVSPTPLDREYVIKRVISWDVGSKPYWDVQKHFKMLPKHVTFLEQTLTTYDRLCRKYFG